MPRSDLVRRSLAAPVRPQVVGALSAKVHAARAGLARFVPLQKLANWQETEWGWSERETRQGFAIEFYEVKAAYREKASWVQPLVNSGDEGHVVLACRERGGVIELLVRAVPETGLATSAALSPSYVRYPGVKSAPPEWLARAKSWSATTESDEGGRFFRDASCYELVRVDDAGEIKAHDGEWVNVNELKLLLRTSNLCTIQLRGIASQLLGAA
jgi:oxidase EvaA